MWSYTSAPELASKEKVKPINTMSINLYYKDPRFLMQSQLFNNVNTLFGGSLQEELSSVAGP